MIRTFSSMSSTKSIISLLIPIMSLSSIIVRCVNIFSDEPVLEYTDYDDPTIISPTLPSIDKTLLIEEYLKHPARVLIINRPPKWGKTTNLRMLRKFLDMEIDEKGRQLAPEKRINRRYFVGGTLRLYSDEPRQLKRTKIAAMTFSMKRQGEYPVILLKLGATMLGNTTYDEIEQRLRSEIEEMFTEHYFLEKYLEENSTSLNPAERKKLDGIVSGHYETDDLKDSLRFLSELLFLHYKRKVHILIDDFDAPVTKMFFHTYRQLKQNGTLTLESQLVDKTFESPDLKRTIELLSDMFRACFHDNDALEKALLVGTMRITNADTFVGMHHIKEYNLLDEEFSSFFGFSQDEVDILLGNSSLASSLPDKRNDLAAWYGGYVSSGGSRTLFNVWSVTQCLLEKGELAVYNTGNCPNDLLDEASMEIRKKIQALLNSKTIISVVNKHITFKQGIGSELFNILLATGNLTPKNCTGQGLNHICEMAIPNLEVKHLYERKMKPTTVTADS